MNKHVNRVLLGSLVMLGVLALAFVFVALVKHSPEAFFLVIFSPFIYAAGAVVEDIWSVIKENKKDASQN